MIHISHKTYGELQEMLTEIHEELAKRHPTAVILTKVTCEDWAKPIRILREAFEGRFGLKEAATLVDNLRDNGVPITIEGNIRDDQLDLLRGSFTIITSLKRRGND